MRGILWITVLAACSGDPECDEVFWYEDADGDGFGAGAQQTGCAADRPEGAVNIAGDCDDADPDLSPATPEVCNGVDDDCDNRVDDLDPSVDPDDRTTWYPDDDQDGFGDTDRPVSACDAPEGYVAVPGDCNDATASINPGVKETCADRFDVDCDGVGPRDDRDADGALACEDCDDADDDIGAPTDWFRDMDEDGFGEITRRMVACEQPRGHVDNALDCDDEDDDVNPDALERCDEIDNDCDKAIDDDDDKVVGTFVWYADFDKDTYGDPDNTADACVVPDMFVDNSDDCDDQDEDLGLPPDWYPDLDDDGYGDEDGTAVNQCFAPDALSASNNEDCDDANPEVNPDTLWFLDADDDGFGDPATSVMQCEPKDGYVADQGDCDDTTHLRHPGRFDFGDTIDNDCDVSVDEDVGNETYTSDDVQAIVDVECDACHVDRADDGLDLTDVFTATVGVASGDVPTMNQVEPGDLRNSYLFHKLEGTHADVGGTGDQMPPAGALSADDLLIWETWILEGAVAPPE